MGGAYLRTQLRLRDTKQYPQMEWFGSERGASLGSPFCDSKC